jgi:small ligand-binding sensory domain FIST
MPSFATRTEGNAIFELDGRPPLEVLQEIFVEADPREQRLLQSALFLGLGMTEGSSHYDRGDFLVRDVLGVHEETGALVLPSIPTPQSVVQFHVRDAHAAAEDLELRAAALHARRPEGSGALLFSCLGRGRGLYGVPNHDSDLLARYFPRVPRTGFFCNGEVGPVERRTFLHTYTSVYALIGPRA